MSTEFPYEVIFKSMNKSDPAESIKKFEASFVIERKHPDFVDFLLEGLKVEDDTISIRIIEWTSYKGHMNFRHGPMYAEFDKARAGVYTPDFADVKHYNFLGPMPFKPNPPVVQLVFVTLKPDTPFDEWRVAFTKQAAPLLAAKGCWGANLGKQMEDPSKVMVIVGWETLEDHTERFRNSPEYEGFMKEFVELGEKYFDSVDTFHIRTCEAGHGV